MQVSELELRRDKPYDEETVSSIRFPNGSVCCIPHAPATEWASLNNVMARIAYEMWLEHSDRILRERQA